MDGYHPDAAGTVRVAVTMKQGRNKTIQKEVRIGDIMTSIFIHQIKSRSIPFHQNHPDLIIYKQVT